MSRRALVHIGQDQCGSIRQGGREQSHAVGQILREAVAYRLAAVGDLPSRPYGNAASRLAHHFPSIWALLGYRQCSAAQGRLIGPIGHHSLDSAGNKGKRVTVFSQILNRHCIEPLALSRIHPQFADEWITRRPRSTCSNTQNRHWQKKTTLHWNSLKNGWWLFTSPACKGRAGGTRRCRSES